MFGRKSLLKGLGEKEKSAKSKKAKKAVRPTNVLPLPVMFKPRPRKESRKPLPDNVLSFYGRS